MQGTAVQETAVQGTAVQGTAVQGSLREGWQLGWIESSFRSRFQEMKVLPQNLLKAGLR